MNSKDSDQTKRMSRLIPVFAKHTCQCYSVIVDSLFAACEFGAGTLICVVLCSALYRFTIFLLMERELIALLKSRGCLWCLGLVCGL